jgi:hypothetical protein
LRGQIKIAIVAGIEVDPIVKKKTTTKTKSKGSSRFHKDRRRKHRHWQVTVYYHDGEKFGRVYIDRERAERFAERQKKSPVVKATRIMEVD